MQIVYKLNFTNFANECIQPRKVFGLDTLNQAHPTCALAFEEELTVARASKSLDRHTLNTQLYIQFCAIVVAASSLACLHILVTTRR